MLTNLLAASQYADIGYL